MGQKINAQTKRYKPIRYDVAQAQVSSEGIPAARRCSLKPRQEIQNFIPR
jgi:hypothetical protein